MKKRILFYTSAKSKRMFSVQQYYRTDIQILKDLGYNVKLSIHWYDFLKFWTYDMSFIYFYRFGFICAFISRMFKKQVYFTGGIDYLDIEFAGGKNYIIQKVLFILCNSLSSASILVSTADVNHVKKIYGNKLPSNCKISFHVIDFDSYQYNSEIKKRNLVITIAWMLRIENVYRKGVDRAVMVFKDFIKSNSDFEMYIIGPIGNGGDYIKQLINKYGLSDKIKMLGSIDEGKKIRLLKESKYYLQLSDYEGFGIASIEALAAGNIVLHSGKGGLKDALGANGILIENYKDVQETSKILCSLQEKGILIEQINNGIRYVQDNFSYNKRLNDFKKIISIK